MKRFVLFFFLANCTVGGLIAGSALAAPGASGPSVLVTLTKLQKGSLPRIVTAYGNVQAAPAAQRRIMAPVAAQVDQVYVHRGEDVARGAPLIRLVPTPQTAAIYAQAKSALQVAKQLVERTRKLVGGRLATGQQLAEAQKSEADARTSLAALEAQGAGGPNLLKAPFNAVVTGLSSSPGAIVAEGAALLDLVQPGGLVLRAGVMPAQAKEIKPGDKVDVSPIGTSSTVSGTVSLRGAMVESGTGLVPVEITLPFGKLLPGEMAEALITTGVVRGYVVPHAAILVDDAGNTYVVQAINGVGKKIAVHIMGSQGGEDVIEGPLDTTSPLVLAGNYQLEDGMRIRVADPDAKAGR